jgi:hypothetical protein
MLCCSCEEKAAAAANVENVFITVPSMQVEHKVAVAKLAYFDVEQKEEGFGEKEAAGPREHGGELEVDPAEMEAGRREDAEEDACRADDKEVAHDRGSVDAVVRFG